MLLVWSRFKIYSNTKRCNQNKRGLSSHWFLSSCQPEFPCPDTWSDFCTTLLEVPVNKTTWLVAGEENSKYGARWADHSQAILGLVHAHILSNIFRTSRETYYQGQRWRTFQNVNWEPVCRHFSAFGTLSSKKVFVWFVECFIRGFSDIVR